MSDETKPKCFVIMPISDPEGYEEGHFRHVYDDLFVPAIGDAGYKAVRADDFHASSMIHVNIVREIIDADIAICDLSSRNPNVLFELGIRQAFDLPVVLVQEKGTPRIFDVGTFNTIDYRRGLVYHEVIEDRLEILKGIKATKEDTRGINSIIKLLELDKASVDNDSMSTGNKDSLLLYSILNKLNQVEDKIDFKGLIQPTLTNKIIPNYHSWDPHPESDLEKRVMDIADFQGKQAALEYIKTKKNELKQSDLSKSSISKYMNMLGILQKEITHGNYID